MALDRTCRRRTHASEVRDHQSYGIGQPHILHASNRLHRVDHALLRRWYSIAAVTAHAQVCLRQHCVLHVEPEIIVQRARQPTHRNHGRSDQHCADGNLRNSNTSRAASYFLRLLRKCGSDGGCEPVPGLGLFPQTFAARGGEFVKLATAIVVRRAPVGFEQSLTETRRNKPGYSAPCSITRALAEICPMRRRIRYPWIGPKSNCP